MVKKAKKTMDPNMTQISISLPSELVKAIDAMAAADNRNRSNFIANTLKKLAETTLNRQAESVNDNVAGD